MPRRVLPFELLVQLFLRLPVEDLVRCVLVCKLWCFVIQSPLFLTAQINYLKDKGNNNLLLFKAKSYSILSDFTYAAVKSTFHTFPVKPGRELILGSCNGLLCLALRSFSSWLVILWNPSVRKCQIIDEIRDNWGDKEKCDMWDRTGTDYALGWHEIRNDFSIVKISNRAIRREVSIYSLRRKAWHLLDGASVPNIMFGWRHCVVRGAIHWMSLTKVLSEVVLGISAFNLSDETFSEMMLLPPGSFALTGMYDSGSIVELGGSIACISYSRTFFERGSKCSVWLMQEYGVAASWTKLFAFEMNGVIERPLGFTRAGRLICKLSGQMPLLVSCNLENCQLEVLGEGGEPACGLVVDFMETALLL